MVPIRNVHSIKGGPLLSINRHPVTCIFFDPTPSLENTARAWPVRAHRSASKKRFHNDNGAAAASHGSDDNNDDNTEASLDDDVWRNAATFIKTKTVIARFNPALAKEHEPSLLDSVEDAATGMINTSGLAGNAILWMPETCQPAFVHLRDVLASLMIDGDFPMVALKGFGLDHIDFCCQRCV